MDLLDDLLVDTYSGNYDAIVKVIADYLGDNTSAEVKLQKLGEGRSNVMAKFGKPTKVINCHMDTVPPSSQWTKKPLKATKEGGRIYGLGTADTKGNIYCALKAASECKPKDVMLLFTVDEELGQYESGVKLFLAAGLGKGLKNAIVCEPTGAKKVGCHKGYYSYKFHVKGSAGHSSLGSAGNPIVKAAKLMVKLDAKGFNVGLVSGGLRGNVVPDSCDFKVSIRTYDSSAKTKALVDALVGGDPAVEAVQSFDGAPLSHPSKLAKGFVEAPFWTEAPLFAKAGISAYVFGAGDIQQAHSPDEYVEAAQLEKAIKHFTHIMEGKG